MPRRARVVEPRPAQWLGAILDFDRVTGRADAWMKYRNLAALYDELAEAIPDRATDTVWVGGWAVWGAKEYAEALKAVVPVVLPNGGRVTLAAKVSLPQADVVALLAWLRETCGEYRRDCTGRHTRWIERYRQDCVDLARYDLVQSLHLKHGVKREDMYREATRWARGLEGGSEETIRASHRRVRRAVRCDWWGRYYVSRHFLVRGLEHWFGVSYPS